ncbi:MAG: CPBP family intramembrane metalloprotease [Actinomycetota bacterium]|nr:CPBP family intramembrane metalloprotease [Actinomycetota bacterium]
MPVPAEDAGRQRVPWTLADISFVFAIVFVALPINLGIFFFLIDVDFGSAPAFLGVFAVLWYSGTVFFAWLLIMRRRAVSFEQLGFRWKGWGPIVLMIPGTVVAFVGTTIVLWVTQSFVGDVATAEDQLAIDNAVLGPGDLIWLLLGVAVLGPIVEELLFRGILYQYLRSKRSVVVAVLISSIVFSVTHFIPTLLPALFVMGVFLALAMQIWDSIYPAIVLHMFYNGLVVVFMYASLT